jgi:hypothetical protein
MGEGDDAALSMAEWWKTEVSEVDKEQMIKAVMDIYSSKQNWDYESALTDDDEVDSDTFWANEDDEMEDAGTEYAVILMDELTANNLDSHVLLKYPEIANWWGTVLKERKKKAEALRKREETKQKAEDDRRARESLLARLTPEERRLLGVK